MTEDKIKLLEFFFKYLALAIAGFWTLIVGTDFVDKKIKETNLAKAQYELHALKLGKDGLAPKASTTLTVNKDNPVWSANNNLCTVTGSYKIENIGEYLLMIDEINLSLYETSTLTEKDIPKGKKVASFSLSPKLDKLYPIYKEKITIKETIAKGNYIERSFGYVVRLKKGALYSIRAKASGGLAGADVTSEEISNFYDNDLTHTSGLHTLCK